jgi:hypothetical protein
MKQFINEIKRMQVLAGIITESNLTDEAMTMGDVSNDEDDDFDLNTAFAASPSSHSYDEVLNIFVSYEDEDTLNEFKSFFPEGKDITKDDYLEFSESIIDDLSEISYIQANWIGLTDDDIYQKAGLI